MKSIADQPAVKMGVLFTLIVLYLLASPGQAEQGREATASSYLERGISFVKKGEIEMQGEFALLRNPSKSNGLA